MRPVNRPIGTPYKKRGSLWSLGYHTGVDFPAPTGTAVRANVSGKVVFEGWGGAYGNMVVIQRFLKRHYYCHLKRATVRTGMRVKKNEIIGRVGSTGNSTGPHLHYEVRKYPWKFGQDVDPTRFF